VLGGESRRPSVRSLRVLGFGEDRIEFEGTRTSWRTLLRHGNAPFLDWSYEDAAIFYRVYYRALEEVVHSSLQLIADKLSPAEQRRRQHQIEEGRAAEALLSQEARGTSRVAQPPTVHRDILASYQLQLFGAALGQ
jgi:hypothetical protein